MVQVQTLKSRLAAFMLLSRIAGFILLAVFIGRVALVSIYGYAGVQKQGSILSVNTEEQNNDNQSEEGKYAEKQFKGFLALNLFEFSPVFEVSAVMLFANYLMQAQTKLCLTVPTPPPNL